MPDIAANKPTAGAPVESAWGGQVHDAVESIQFGQVTVQLNAAAVGTDQVVTFPRAYASAPRLVASSVATSSAYMSIVISVTPTQATLNATTKTGNTATATVLVNWIAIGTLA